MKKIFLVLILFALIGPSYLGQVFADQSSSNLLPHSYVFHLKYSAGNLTKDIDFNFPFDASYEEYTTIPRTADSYSGKIISTKGAELATFYFSPASDASGNLAVKAPYFPNAKTAFFYNQSGQELLSIDLAPFGALCNENGACDTNYGEDAKNCPADCHGDESAKNILDQEMSTESSATSAKDFYNYLPLIIGGGVIVLLAAWAVYKYRK